MDYEQDYSKNNFSKLQWLGNKNITLYRDETTVGQDISAGDDGGNPEALLDNEDFN